MTTVLFPIAGIFLATFLVVLFFSKKNNGNTETKIYSKMLIINLVYSLLCVIGYWYAKSIGTEIIIGYIQKWYMLNMLLLIVYIIIYNLNLMNFGDSKRKRIIMFIWVSYFIFFILSLLAPINVINYDDILDGFGLSYDIVIIATIFYFLIIIISSIYLLIKNKKDFSKDIPFITLLILYLLGLLVRKFFPSIMFENFFFSFMLLIMYHTIENPDVKMLNEITLAKAELEKANRVKSEFISSMSHEIRTPLNAIVGFSELTKYADTLEEAKENSEDIINASNNLVSIMDRMTDVFAIERESSEIIEEEYNPKDVIEQVITLYESKINEKGITLIKNIDNIPLLIGDKDIIQKIVLNIIDNAYKFTEKGSITISTKYLKNDLTLIIEDTGIGIKEEELKTIFEPFAKTSDTKNTSYSGLGLGLFITKSILEQINGKIEIESKYGEYTKVSVSIPQKKVGK